MKDLYPEYRKNAYKSVIKRERTQYQKGSKDLNRHLTKEDIRLANKCIKMCSMSLAIREMWIKITVRDHIH